MTLNLNYLVSKHGMWPNRKKLIVQAIKEQDPDIIAFQAVAKDAASEQTIDQAREICKELPQYDHHFFQPANIHPNGRQEGSAIISKIRMVETDFIKLTTIDGLEDTNPRVLLRVRFDLNSSTIHVFNGHFSWVTEQALKNIEEANRYINSVSTHAVLVGDLNTPPDSEVFNTIKETGWVDTWEKLNPGVEGFTFESDKPFTRIDYVWSNIQLKDKVETIKIIQGQQGEDTRFSDHLGLIATFTIG